MSHPSSSSNNNRRESLRPPTAPSKKKPTEPIEISSFVCIGVLQYEMNTKKERECPVCRGVEVEYIQKFVNTRRTSRVIQKNSNPKPLPQAQGGILFFFITSYNKDLVARTPGIVPSQFRNAFPALVYTEKTLQESALVELQKVPDLLSKQWKAFPGQVRILAKEGKFGLSVMYSLGKAELASFPSNVYRGSQVLYTNAAAGAKAIYKYIKSEDPKH